MSVINWRHPEDEPKVYPGLLDDLQDAAEHLGYDVFISCGITGHDANTTSGNPSRHVVNIGGYTSAVDVSMLNGACIGNAPKHWKARADAMVQWLCANRGYEHRASESGHDKVILWQVAGHYNHFHISNRKRVKDNGGGNE